MFPRTIAVLVSLVISAGCDNSKYERLEFGDEIGLVSKNNRALDIPPDVVFYESVGKYTYGVRRLSYSPATDEGFWSKCLLFKSSNKGVLYFGPSRLQSSAHFQSDASLKFAKKNCYNFGAVKE